jgi:hypothetical protein
LGSIPKREEPGKTGRHPVLKYRVPHGSQPRPGRAPDPDGWDQIPRRAGGWVLHQPPWSFGFDSQTRGTRETRAPPCVKVPGSSRVPPPRSLVRDGQTSPRLVFSGSTCPPLFPPHTHANNFVIGTAVINTHAHWIESPGLVLKCYNQEKFDKLFRVNGQSLPSIKQCLSYYAELMFGCTPEYHSGPYRGGKSHGVLGRPRKVEGKL